MQILLNGILPVFAIALIGYVLGNRGVFDAQAAGIINRLVFLIAVPALSFKLIVEAPFENFDWTLLLGFFLSEVLIYLIAVFVSRKLLKCDLKESVLLGLAASFGNNLLFVLPIVINLYGAEAALPLVAIISLDSIVIFGGTIVIMEALKDGDFSYGVFAKNIFGNPPIVSMLLGIVFVLLSIDVPTGVTRFLTLSGNAAVPCALFSLGIVLSQIKVTGRFVTSTTIAAIKLFLHPLIASAIFSILVVTGDATLTPEDARIPLLSAAAPCGAMAFVTALNYNVRTDAIAPAIFISTIGALVSLTVIASI